MLHCIDLTAIDHSCKLGNMQDAQPNGSCRRYVQIEKLVCSVCSTYSGEQKLGLPESRDEAELQLAFHMFEAIIDLAKA